MGLDSLLQENCSYAAYIPVVVLVKPSDGLLF